MCDHHYPPPSLPPSEKQAQPSPSISLGVGGGIGVGGFGVFLGSNIPGSTKKKIHKKNRQLCVQCMMGARRLAALNLVYRLRPPPPPPHGRKSRRGGEGGGKKGLFISAVRLLAQGEAVPCLGWQRTPQTAGVKNKQLCRVRREPAMRLRAPGPVQGSHSGGPGLLRSLAPSSGHTDRSSLPRLRFFGGDERRSRSRLAKAEARCVSYRSVRNRPRCAPRATLG